MTLVEFRKKNIVPKTELVKEAVLIGGLTFLVEFILSFFGITGILSFLPPGFQIIVKVIVAVYLRSLIDIKIAGKQLL